MENTKPFFLSVTERIFSNWTALKLVVEHDMGPVERAREFCSYMTDVLYMNENLINSEVADELENYLETQFNTEIQDESTVQVAEELLRFYQYCIAQNESVAQAEFNKLPPTQYWLVPQVGQPVAIKAMSQSEPMSHSEPMSQSEPTLQQPESSSHESMDVDQNEGNREWTVIRRQKRR